MSTQAQAPEPERQVVICPYCNHRLFQPPNAPVFRCGACNTLLHRGGENQQRPVSVCTRCQRMLFVPSEQIFRCVCGQLLQATTPSNRDNAAQQRSQLQQVLARLPVRRYDGGPVGRDEDDRCCPICLSDFVINEEIRSLPCKHVFHKSCIDTWFSTKVECPFCRGGASDILKSAPNM
eukprot:Rmarinus@m.26181